jgi:uncharacterized protein involved in exopolysaccharide biosynthesis
MTIENTQFVETDSPGFSDFVAILKRRFSIFAHALIILICITVVLAFGLPPVYESAGTILIEDQSIPEDFVPSAITSYADERIQIISQRVMSTDNLAGLVEKYALFDYGQDDESVVSKVFTFQDTVIVEPISADVINPSSGRPSRATIAFTVAFRHEEPETARDVARDLTNLFLEENRRSRAEQAMETVAFLESQALAYQGEIDRIEGEISQFKSDYQGLLPENVSFNMQSLERQQRRLDDLRAEIRTQEERIRFLSDERRTLVLESGIGVDRMAELQEELARALANYSPDHPDVLSLRREIDLLRQSEEFDDSSTSALAISQVRQELALAREKYSANHPDVRRLERTLASLEAQGESEGDATALVSNPAVRAVDSEIRERNARLISLRQTVREVQGEIGSVEIALEGVPEVERQYNTLVRRYEDAIERYDGIQAKLSTARMSSELETEELGQRFRLIDQPRLAGEPASPNRIGILALGVILSGAIAIAALALAEAMDGRIRSARDVRDVLGIPPIAAIPQIETHTDRRRRFTRVVVHASFAGFVVSSAVIGLYYVAA